MSNRYIIVVRKEGAPNHGRIYAGRDVAKLLRHVKADLPSIRSTVDWTPAMLAYVDQNYQLGSKQAMADQLSKISGQRVTKNAVISKAHSRGLTMRRSP